MISLFILQILANPVLAHATPCIGECIPLSQEIAKKNLELNRVKDILEKNESYLKTHPNISPSITVKINSNKLMAKLQIETVQNEMTAYEESLKKRGCTGCQISTKEN